MEGPDGARKTPYFQRTFHPQETREVRIYLRGGADRAEIAGAKGRIAVRIDGGGGDDASTNSSQADAAKTRFYDYRGKNRFAKGKGAKIDKRPYKRPPARILRARYALDWGMQAITLPDLYGQSRSERVRRRFRQPAVFRLSKKPFLFASFLQRRIGDQSSQVIYFLYRNLPPTAAQSRRESSSQVFRTPSNPVQRTR